MEKAIDVAMQVGSGDGAARIRPRQPSEAYRDQDRTHSIPPVRAVLVILVSMTMLGGCALFDVHSISVEYSGTMDSHTRVEVLQEARRNALWTNPDRNWARLSLRVVQDGGPDITAEVGRLEGRFSENPRFELGKLEGWTDSAGKRLWITDTNTQRVIASFDRGNNAFTGFRDDPPLWAKLQGGIPINMGALPAPRDKSANGAR